jgi:hypothetical protein
MPGRKKGVMGSVSLGVFGIIMGLVFLASLWTIISNIRRRMGIEVKGETIIHVAGTNLNLEENRRQERSKVIWPVTMEGSAGSVDAETKDISLGGAFIICKNPLPLQEQFKLTIKPPGLGQMSLNAEVVWSNGGVPEEKVIHRGMGIRFIKITDEEHQWLKSAFAVATMSQNMPAAPAEPAPPAAAKPDPPATAEPEPPVATTA